MSFTGPGMKHLAFSMLPYPIARSTERCLSLNLNLGVGLPTVAPSQGEFLIRGILGRPLLDLDLSMRWPPEASFDLWHFALYQSLRMRPPLCCHIPKASAGLRQPKLEAAIERSLMLGFLHLTQLQHLKPFQVMVGQGSRVDGRRVWREGLVRMALH